MLIQLEVIYRIGFCNKLSSHSYTKSFLKFGGTPFKFLYFSALERLVSHKTVSYKKELVVNTMIKGDRKKEKKETVEWVIQYRMDQWLVKIDFSSLSNDTNSANTSFTFHNITCDYVIMWLCDYVIMWLCDHVIMWLCDY